MREEQLRNIPQHLVPHIPGVIESNKMSEDYSNLANYELQTALKHRGLHVTGIRVDLIQRLVRDDAINARVSQRNANRRTSDPELGDDKAIKKEPLQGDNLLDQIARTPNKSNSSQRKVSDPSYKQD